MIIDEYKINNIFFGIWRIDETIDQLYAILNKKRHTRDIYLQNIKNGEKLREKLAVRALLKSMLRTDISISYTETGKPILINNDLHISISHTNGYVAVALSTDTTFGIDIEYISDRVTKIKDKFINKEEYIDFEQYETHLLIHWSAKESLYKAINKKGIDFKNSLTIEKFIPQLEGFISAYFISASKKEYTINYSVKPEYVITVAFAKN